jgi:hypothetical protein
MMEISTLEPIGPSLSGVSTVAARVDLVRLTADLSHTTETQGVLPLSRGGTGGGLSPAAGATHCEVKDYHNG